MMIFLLRDTIPYITTSVLWFLIKMVNYNYIAVACLTLNIFTFTAQNVIMGFTLPNLPHQSFRNTLLPLKNVAKTKSTNSKWLSLQMGFWDNIENFFDNNKGGDENETTVELFTIPAKSIKVGALRLLLTLHLMGQQNTPTKGSWKCRQQDDNHVAMQHMVDETGNMCLIIGISEKGVHVERRGTLAPSIQFLMQESILLQGLLEELDHVIYSGDLQESDRLMVLKYPIDGLDKARENLPFA